MKREKIITPKYISFYKDIDNDGVPDWKDCRPFNPRLQHVKPNLDMQERLKNLPIFFTTGEGNIQQLLNSRKLYRLEDRNVPSDIEILRQRFYSMIKKRPDVIGEIERSRPRAIVFTKRGIQTTQSMGITYPTEKEMAVEEGKAPGSGLVVSRITSQGRGKNYTKDDIYESGSTVIHELEHVKQQRKWRGKPKLQARMSKGKYDKRREEQLAYKAEEKAMDKLIESQSYPYEFSPTYEKRKEAIEAYSKEHPEEKRKYDRLQKKFFEGYRKLVD